MCGTATKRRSEAAQLEPSCQETSFNPSLVFRTIETITFATQLPSKLRGLVAANCKVGLLFFGDDDSLGGELRNCHFAKSRTSRLLQISI